MRQEGENAKTQMPQQRRRSWESGALIARTLFQGTRLPLTTWFLAIYLIS